MVLNRPEDICDSGSTALSDFGFGVHFPKNQTIRTLEIGCGQGDFFALRQKRQAIQGPGTRLRGSPLKYAESLGLRVDQGDIQSLKLKDETFDLVIALHVLEQVRDPEETIREMFRVLRPGWVCFCGLFKRNPLQSKSRR